MAKEKVYVWMSQEYIDDYNDPEQCFGRKKGGYDPKASSCTPRNCVDVEMCKKLSKGGIPILEGTKPTLAVDNTVPEKTEESPKEESKETVEWSRESVLEAVKEVITEKGEKPEVVSTATRDKVFIGKDDVFVVTKRALKIHRLERGEKLGIDSKFWKVDNKGIAVSYDGSLDFRAIAKSALDGLYIESLPQPEIPKTKTDLFDTEELKEEPKREVKPEVKPEPEVEVSVEPEPEPEPIIERVRVGTKEEYTPELLDKGEVTKVLKITSYSNGYNEISIVSKASIDAILTKVESILG